MHGPGAFGSAASRAFCAASMARRMGNARAPVWCARRICGRPTDSGWVSRYGHSVRSTFCRADCAACGAPCAAHNRRLRRCRPRRLCRSPPSSVTWTVSCATHNNALASLEIGPAAEWVNVFGRRALIARKSRRGPIKNQKRMTTKQNKIRPGQLSCDCRRQK